MFHNNLDSVAVSKVVDFVEYFLSYLHCFANLISTQMFSFFSALSIYFVDIVLASCAI